MAKTCRCTVGTVRDRDGLFPVVCVTVHGNIGGSVNRLLAHLLARTHTQVSRIAVKKAKADEKNKKRKK